MANRKLTEQLAQRLAIRQSSGVSHVRTDDELRRSVDTAMTLAGESAPVRQHALAAAASSR